MAWKWKAKCASCGYVTLYYATRGEATGELEGHLKATPSRHEAGESSQVKLCDYCGVKKEVDNTSARCGRHYCYDHVGVLKGLCQACK